MTPGVDPIDLVCGLPGVLSPGCGMARDAVSGAASSLTSNVVGSLGQAMFDSWWLLQAKVLTMWVNTPTPTAADLAGPGSVRGYVVWLAQYVLIASAILAAGRTMLSRDARSLADFGRTLVVTIVVTGVGVTAATALIRAGDAIAQAVVGDDAISLGSAQAADVHGAVAVALGTGAPILLAILGLLTSVVQFFVILARNAVLPLVVILLPLAAASGVTTIGRAWLGRLTAWLLALAFYKPAAAVIYAVVLDQARTADSVTKVLTALAGMTAAVLVLPALIKLLAPVTAGGGGGGAGYAASSAAGAAARAVSGRL